MNIEQAREQISKDVARSFNDGFVLSERGFKALRVIDMEESRELYESLSKEFIRKGIASDRFSELEKLYRIAKISLQDYEDLQSQLVEKDERIKLLEQDQIIFEEKIDNLYSQLAQVAKERDEERRELKRADEAVLDLARCLRELCPNHAYVAEHVGAEIAARARRKD